MTSAVTLAQSASAGSTRSFKNRIINGGFDVWQRGTSFPSAVHTSYTADRWWVVTDGVGTVNVTRNDISALGLNSQYSLRAERTAGTNRWVIGTQLETSVVKALLGETVTFSCKLREGASLTSNIDITVGTSVSETKFTSVVDGGSFTVPNASLNTTSFTQVSFTFTIPAGSAALGLKIELSATQAGASGAFFEVAEAQLEVGSAATNFDYRFYGTELPLCQRYFARVSAPGIEFYPCMLTGGYIFPANWYKWITAKLPVTMRSAPSVTFYPNPGSTAEPGRARYFTGNASGAGNNYVVYGTDSSIDYVKFAVYNEHNAITCYGAGAWYDANAEL
jgi:hypothetical protein